MTFEEMIEKFKEEWLLIEYDELDEELTVKRGKVLFHSPNKSEVYKKLMETGEIEKRRRAQIRREIKYRVESNILEIIQQRLGGFEEYENAIDKWTEKIVSGKATALEAAENMAEK